MSLCKNKRLKYKLVYFVCKPTFLFYCLQWIVLEFTFFKHSVARALAFFMEIWKEILMVPKRFLFEILNLLALLICCFPDKPQGADCYRLVVRRSDSYIWNAFHQHKVSVCKAESSNEDTKSITKGWLRVAARFALLF